MAVTNDTICSVCSKKIRTSDTTVKCTLCDQPVHIKCLPVYNKTDIEYANHPSNNWSCTTCLRELFPFSTLEENQDIINYNNRNDNNLNLGIAKDLLFDPFEAIPEENDGEDMNDPDMNFYKTFDGSTCKTSSYYNVEEVNKLTQKRKNDSKFTMLHLNIRSMAKNYRMLQNTLAIIDNKYDVIILSETWLKPHNIDTFALDGYQHEYITRTGKAGGGLSIYIKNAIQYNILPEMTVNTIDTEMLWIELKKDNLFFEKNLIIGGIYRTPGSNPNSFIELLNEKLLDMKQKNKYCI
jgi:hypothetical protein